MKMSSYEEFLRMPRNPLTFEDATRAWDTIREAQESRFDSEFNEIVDAMISAAIRYAKIRADWSRLTVQEVVADGGKKDQERTAAHDIFIGCLQKVIAYMYKNGRGNSFAVDEILGEDRKRIGDFACYLAYVYALNER